MGSLRRFLIPGALVAFVAAVGVFFFSSSQPAAHAQPASVPQTAPSTTASPGGYGTSGSAVGAGGALAKGHATAPSSSLRDKTLPLPRRLLPQGRILFVDNCSSCHGTDAAGSSRAPNLLGLGAGTVDFWVSTGRMPLAEPTQQPAVKPPRFNREQTLAIAAYVSSLLPGGQGIPIPNTADANQANGQNLFALNCAGCHTITGVGDALSAGAYAPSLYPATPTQVYEAVRIGPGQMPRFSPQQLNPAQVNDLVSYVEYLHHASDPGGAGLGHVGPVTEGFIGLFIGLGALMLVAFWIGDRA